MIKNRLTAIAMVNIEVNQCDALDLIMLQGMTNTYRDIIEKTKAHGFINRGVVTRRPDITKCNTILALHHQIGGQHRCACGAARSLQAVCVHQGVGVDSLIALAGRKRKHPIQMRFTMHPSKCFHTDERRIKGLHDIKQALRQKHIVY